MRKVLPSYLFLCCYYYYSYTPIVSAAFLHNFFQPYKVEKPKPDLLQITDEQEDIELNIQLLLGPHDDGPQLAITNMVVGLCHDSAEYEHIGLPGADGQHKKLSTGHRSLKILEEGRFINMKGTQHVKGENGCWEMCWRKDKPAGTLICGFHVPEEYSRNDAVLHKGNLYVSFPLWTVEGLRVGQEEGQKVREECQRLLQVRDEELEKIEQTDNPIMKAYHLQAAYAAVDKYGAMPHDLLSTIPNDDQVVRLQNDILLTIKGLVWGQQDSDRYSDGYEFLGTASLHPYKPEDDRKLMP